MHPEVFQLLKTIVWDPDDEEAEVFVDTEESKEIVGRFLERVASDKVGNPYEMASDTPLFYSLLLVFDAITIDEYIEAYNPESEGTISVYRHYTKLLNVGRKMRDLRLEMENEDAS